MFTAAVYAGKRFFVKKANESVTSRDFLHNFHSNLVMIGRNVGGRINGSEFVLSGRNFVMFGFGENAEFPEFLVKIRHVRLNARLDYSEVMVVEFLTLRGFCAEKRSARKDKVFALVVHRLVHEEVFLFGTDRGANAFHVVVAEEFKYSYRLLAQCLHRTEKRSLFVESLAAVRTERRRNTKRFVLYKRVRSRIPRRVAARFEGGAKTAGRERGRVGFAFNKFLARKLHNHAAVGCGRDKAVVFFRGNAGKRLEPVRKVGSAFFDRPVFHCFGDRVRDFRVKFAALVDSLFKRRVDGFGKTGAHNSVVEHQTSESFGNVHKFIPPK